MVSTQEGIAIAEICVYIPIFILTLIVVFRHGFRRQLGWIYLAIFCIIRLAGAGFKIASVNNPTNITDIEWSSILSSVGLSPLLLATLGLLKRVTDEVSNHSRSNSTPFSGGIIANVITKRATANSRRSRVIQVALLPTTIALIFCVVGGIDESNSSASEISEGKKFTKIGVMIFFLIYILLFSLVVITIKDVGNAPRGEKYVYLAVVCALPFLAVRLLWSILATFSNNSDFSLAGGKPLIQLFMAIVEEFIIVCFYTLVGLTIEKN
jgi:hypothetical protein